MLDSMQLDPPPGKAGAARSQREEGMRRRGKGEGGRKSGGSSCHLAEHLLWAGPSLKPTHRISDPCYRATLDLLHSRD